MHRLPLNRARRLESVAGWLFVLPAVIGFAAFHAWPTARAVGISFTDWNLLAPPQFVGLANYAELIGDERFWRGMGLAGAYALINIPLQTLLGLGLALAMHRLTSSLFVKSVVLMPYLLSNVLVAMIWLWMLDPVLGVVNHALEASGLSRQPFFSSDSQALVTVAVVNTWRHMGLVALLFLAGLQNIPSTLYQAAAIDGAGEWQTFRRITLPLLRPVMVFVLVTSITGSFQVFDTIAVTTNGGPQESTSVIVHYIVTNAFSYYRMGYASAMSVILMLTMLLVTLVQMRVLRADQSDLA